MCRCVNSGSCTLRSGAGSAILQMRSKNTPRKSIKGSLCVRKEEREDSWPSVRPLAAIAKMMQPFCWFTFLLLAENARKCIDLTPLLLAMFTQGWVTLDNELRHDKQRACTCLLCQTQIHLISGKLLSVDVLIQFLEICLEKGISHLAMMWSKCCTVLWAKNIHLDSLKIFLRGTRVTKLVNFASWKCALKVTKYFIYAIESHYLNFAVFYISLKSQP